MVLYFLLGIEYVTPTIGYKISFRKSFIFDNFGHSFKVSLNNDFINITAEIRFINIIKKFSGIIFPKGDIWAV